MSCLASHYTIQSSVQNTQTQCTLSWTAAGRQAEGAGKERGRMEGGREEAKGGWDGGREQGEGGTEGGREGRKR